MQGANSRVYELTGAGIVADGEWWRGGVFYQIYPRSYKDSNKDGIGDLKGITGKLDYIASLGVDGIWISPFFKSPMKDYGYDVSDYCAVDPVFGTLDDFRCLLDTAHRLGVRVIVDMIMSHTSDEHPWFRESASGRDNPKADWYVWADPKPDGTPPNNWLSVFGGSAWQFHVFRGQYYMHNFLKEQPDLNYHNPDVVQAMLDQCRFWLDFGVDGFRFDAVNFCTHDKYLRDNPARRDGGFATQLEFPEVYAMQWHRYDKSQPENIDFMRRIRKMLDAYPGTMALAEIGDDDPVQLAAEYTASPEVLHTAYSFALMMDRGNVPPASMFRDRIEAQRAQPGESWPAWAISNHDVVRAASRWSGTEYGHDPRLSKMLVALLTSIRGTPFLYQGDELGLPEADIPFERILDPWGKYLYPRWKGRDGCRTPMPWTDKAGGGFTGAKDSWLPIPATHREMSVARQEKDQNSVLNFTRHFLRWRKTRPAMVTGEMRFIDSGRDDVLIFERSGDGDSVLCAFNLSKNDVSMDGVAMDPYEARFFSGDEVVFSSVL